MESARQQEFCSQPLASSLSPQDSIHNRRMITVRKGDERELAPSDTGVANGHSAFDGVAIRVTETLDRIAALNARYRAGDIHARVPDALHDSAHVLDELVERHLPISHAAFQAAARSLFFSLPVAFDPAESIGPYLAAVDRDADGQPYRF